MPSKIFPFPPQSSSACSFKSSVFLSGMTSNDSTATFLPFSGVKFHLESDIHFDIWDFLLKFETQRQGIAASYWSTSIYLRFNNKISSRNMDSQRPNGKILPAFLIFLSKNLMAEAGTFSTNNFLFSKISAVLGNRGMINWTHSWSEWELEWIFSPRGLSSCALLKDALLRGRMGAETQASLASMGQPWEERATYARSPWAGRVLMEALSENNFAFCSPVQPSSTPPSPPISSSSSTPMSSALSQSLLFSSFHYSPVFFGRRLVCDKRT